MEAPRPGSGNATDESFEHVELDHSPDKDRAQATGPTAAAAATEQQQGAPPQPAVVQSSTNAAEAGPAAPAARTIAAAEAPSSPPATKALQSMLGFFNSIAGSPQPAAKEQKEAPTAGAAAPQQQPAEAAGNEQAAGAAAAETADEHTYDPVAAFESEALEAAERLQHGVEEVGQKLLHGAAEAKESLTSFAQGLSSWWSQLDAAAQGSSAPQSRSASSRQLAADVAAAADQLGLEGGETVLESFACSLLQMYTSTSNFFTPVQQIPFPGSLHITSARLCFVFDDNSIAPIKLSAKAIKPGGVTKLPADGEKGLPARLEVSLEAQGQKLVLAEFALAELEVDSALALLEHLAELSE